MSICAVYKYIICMYLDFVCLYTVDAVEHLKKSSLAISTEYIYIRPHTLVCIKVIYMYHIYFRT